MSKNSHDNDTTKEFKEDLKTLDQNPGTEMRAISCPRLSRKNHPPISDSLDLALPN